MSDVWKRLANVARGTVKTWSQGERDVDGVVVERDVNVTPVASAAPPRVLEPSPTATTRGRALLDMALADGVISREEYETRLRAIDSELDARVGTPGTPKKRTL